MDISNIKLLTSLSFLRLKSGDLFWYQWFWPSVMCALFHVLFWTAPAKPAIFGDHGIVGSANNLLNMVIGFYIAALAAVATFSSKNLDSAMKGHTPKIKIVRGGSVSFENLTRRRFLCVLFGYCAFVSILLYVSSLIIKFSLPSINTWDFFVNNIEYFQFAWLTYYFFLSASLLITTLLGLHYLIDRIHRE